MTECARLSDWQVEQRLVDLEITAFETRDADVKNLGM